jgi:hypothetical protein
MQLQQFAALEENYFSLADKASRQVAIRGAGSRSRLRVVDDAHSSVRLNGWRPALLKPHLEEGDHRSDGPRCAGALRTTQK